MEASGFEIVRLELKYCERCGGLWMRTQGSGEVYCPQCVGQMFDLPTPRDRRKADLPMNDIEVKGQYEEWALVYGERGNA